MTDMEEIWRPYDTTYEVSNLGNVRNLHTKLFRFQSENPRTGYMTISIQNGQEHRNHYVHRMVATAFNLPRRPDQVCVDHQDRNRSNNNVSNLRWLTYAENAANRNEAPPRVTNTGYFHITRKTKTFESKKKGETTYYYYVFQYKGTKKNCKNLQDAITQRDAHMETLTRSQAA
jgi:hypothetical protein